MDLKNKYFYSVHSYIYSDFIEKNRLEELKDILLKFEMIFKCGYILPYKDIQQLYGNVSRNKRIQFNNNNMVSVSLHKDNPEEMDILYKKEFDGYVEDAFQSFIYQEPSIVLNESIINELKHYKYHGIYLERLFYEPISLKYMEGISIYPSLLEPFFEKIDINKYEYYARNIKFDIGRDIDIDFLDNLKTLMKKYDIEVPVVSIITGNEYHENNEYRKVLSNLKN